MDASAKKLCDKIIADARIKAAEIVDEARSEAAATLKQAEVGAHRSSDEYLAKVKESAERDAARRVSVGQLDLRNDELALKQELIDTVFLGALQRLRDMPGDEYANLIKSMIIDSDPKGDLQLHVAEADRGRIGPEIVDAVNKELESKGGGRVQFGGYIDSIESGFVLKAGDVALNFSFADIIDDLRETMEGQVVSLLFDS